MKMFVGFPVIDIHHQFGSQEQRNLHSTIAYWDNVSHLQCNQIASEIAEKSGWAMYFRKYRLIKNLYPNLFGPEQNIPVLTYYENEWITELAEWCRKYKGADTTYKFNPHITVDLTQAWPPLNEVLFLPIHMWRGKNPPRPIVRK